MFLDRNKSIDFIQFSVSWVPCWHVFYLPHILNFINACIWCLAYAIGQADAFCVAYQKSEHTIIIFDETMRQDRLPINMSVASEPILLPAYIKDSCMKLWDHALSTYLKGHDSSKKKWRLCWI